MKKPLLDVIFMSGKRKNTLLLLKDGPQEMEHLLGSLDTTRQALLPQIRILEEHYLVSHNKETYELTPIGKLIVKNMVPLTSTVDVLDNNIDYWGTHDLDFIPTHLINRLNQLCSCRMINPPLMELYDINKDFHKSSVKSQTLSLFFTFLYPNFPEIYSEWIDNVDHIRYIISRELLERIKSNYIDEFNNYINTGKFDLFVYNHETNFVSFGYNDYCAFFRLLSKTGEYDNKQLICFSSSAVKWTTELYEHFLRDSTPITEL